VKKLPLILTLLFILICVGGYFLYEKVLKTKPVDAWSLVPESSVVVYEAGTCQTCNDSLNQSEIGDIIQATSFYSKKSDSLQSVVKFLTASHFDLVSLHVIKKDDFDFVYYAHIDPKAFNTILEQWKKQKGVKISSYEFNSVIIQEALFGQLSFSWFFVGDVWVGSFTPFLIEDVIRTYESGNELNFKKRVAEIYQLPRANKDAGNLYINLKNFTEWFKTFADVVPPAFIQSFGKSAIVDIKTNDNSFVLNGFSSDSSYNSAYALSIFSNQNPVPFSTKKIISNRTVMLASYGVSQGSSFKKNLMAFEKRNHYNDTLTQISKTLNVNIDQLFDNIKGELGVCFVESKGKEISKVMLLETANPEVWMNQLNALSSKLSIDTIFFERFSDYEIRELPLFRFSEKMFWPLVSGFDRTYYTSLGNTIILGDDLEELKKFLNDIDEEETWGKSVSQNKYLESTLLESNVSLYINTPRIWNVLSGSLNPKWKDFIQHNKQLLHSLGMGALQFSHLSESFYTNISWAYHRKGNEPKHLDTNRKVIASIDNDISKITVFKSHVDRRDEALVLDSSKNLSLISLEGKMLWKIQLDGMIKGNIEQIDFYKNGKLQYYFATHNKIYIVDRLGNSVEPFPISISSGEIEYASVIDYDHSHKYRFLVATKSGKLWMYDKEGKVLEGWNPKNIGEEFMAAPQHHRIRGKDYILAISKDGKVYMQNRKGESLKKFPLNLNAKLAGDYFLENGKDASSTYFTVVSRDGIRIKFNLEGEVQSRETLLKASPTAQFSLIKESNEKSYLILRQEAKQLTLMDDSGKDLIVNDFIGQDPVSIEYSDFGAGRIFITATDTRQDLSFVYDGQGNLLTTPPVESYAVIPRVTEDGKLLLFSIYQKTLTIQPLP
jgi:hypothetical protein